MQFEDFLKTDEIILRAVEPSDVDILYEWENNTRIWNVSSTLTPYSKKALNDYIESAQFDIYTNKQLRLIIELRSSKQAVGTIDLYDFDAHNRRAGIGIFVVEEFQNQKIATKALDCLLKYCKSILLLHQVYVDVPQNNVASLQLFQNAGFESIGTKKDWILCDETFVDVVVMQKIL